MRRKGFTLNGKHTYYTFGLSMLKRAIGSPPKDSHIERVPFSNVTYNFDSLFGKSYGERKLAYEFDFIELDISKAEDKIIKIREWLQFSGSLDLYDDYYPHYHFSVREPIVDSIESHGVYTIKVTFWAAPAMLPNPDKLRYTAVNVTLPDVNGDGKVDMSDASLILAAYAALSTEPPQDPGLTPKQLKAADANMDGKIDASDAAMVSEFYSILAQSDSPYDGMSLPAAWAAYLNDHFYPGGGEVY